MSTIPAPGRLSRTLRLPDAVVIGAGSMIGAGVYSVWPAATRSAGDLLLIGLAVAALVAFLNAMSTARLARLYPESGGTYVYGRERLGPTWGFIAGWGFVAGKIASCAAMASTIGAYVVPDHAKVVALAAIAAITSVNIGGLHRTVLATKVLLAVSAVALTAVVVSGAMNANFEARTVWPLSGAVLHESLLLRTYDVLQSAGLLFFAFAGYARIATLGEEVREPERVIPQAIIISLSIVLFVYSAVGFTLLATMSPGDLGTSSDPLRRLVATGPLASFAPFVWIGAAIAALGALLNLLPGVSRTALAMARRHDLPHVFAHVDQKRSLPVRAELSVAACAAVVILVFDLRSSIALSGVGVLIYYSITHLSSLTLPSRPKQKITAIAGFVGCIGLVACLPVRILATGCTVIASGLCVRALHVLVARRSRDVTPGSSAG